MVACVRAGFWQLDRWDQKLAEADRRASQHALPELTALPASLEPAEAGYRRVRVEGHFTRALVASGGVPFKLNGYAALGVFQVADGPKVLVLRGWIPYEGWTHHLELPLDHELTGVLQPLEGQEGIVPLTDPRTEEPLWPLGRQPLLWFFSRGVGIPWPSIAAAEEVRYPAVLVEGPQLPSLDERPTIDLPAGGYTTWLQTEHHHHYALQWFAFAAIAVGLRGWFWWRSRSALQPRQP